MSARQKVTGMLEKNELAADLEFMKIGEPDGAYDLANDLNSARKKDLISALYEYAYAHGVVEAALNYGNHLEAIGQRNSAVDWYAKAYESGDARAAVLIGQILRKQGDLIGALNWYRKSESVPEGALWHSQVAAELGYVDEAIDVLNRNRLVNAQAASELVIEHDHLGKQEALELLTSHWERRDLDEDAYDVGVPLGNLLCDIGETEKALAVYEEAAMRGDAHASFNLGIELLETEKSEALFWIQKAKEQGDKRARKWLKKAARDQ